MQRFVSKFITPWYLLLLVGLFFYSFTQVDLSLAFTSNASFQEFFRSFQYVGYFNRPLATGIYITLLLLLFVSYLVLLKLAATQKLTKQTVWKIILFTAVLFTFSYNAFSYDLFNYIFDAKIVTMYQQNPYLHKALDFADDPMLSFMRWTHRVYPYGPIWLGITVPLSYLGFGFFLPTFFLFKALMSASFLGTVYFIGKIFQKVFSKKEVLGLVFFGLNPLIIIESLISGHLDMVMMFFAVWAFYLLLQKRYLWAFLLLGISIGIKFATGFLLPIFIWVLFTSLRAKRSNLNQGIAASPLAPRKDGLWETIFGVALMLMFFATIVASLRTNFQPWYLVGFLTFAVFLAHRYYVVIPSLIVSFFALLIYVPFLYTGNWDPPIPMILLWIQISALVLSLALTGVYKIYRR